MGQWLMIWSLFWHNVLSWLDDNIRCTYLNYASCVLVLCLGHICPVMPSIGLSHPISGAKTIDLSSVIELLQSYLLCGELANNFFTDPESNARCVQLVGNFGDQALRARSIGLSMEFELCLCWVFAQCKQCSVELFPLNRVLFNGSHETVFLTLRSQLLAEIWSSNLSLIEVKLSHFCRITSCIWCTTAWHLTSFYHIGFWFCGVILLQIL